MASSDLLRLFESAELVHDFYSGHHESKPAPDLARSIVASFRQGRELFDAASNMDPLARPIVQYYAVASLCRGLTLTLRPQASESQLAASHGLTIRGAWPNDPADIVLRVTKGVFHDLTVATGGVVLRHGTSRPGTGIRISPVIPGQQFTFRDLVTLLPVLDVHVRQWLGVAVPRVNVKKVEVDDVAGQAVWSFSGPGTDRLKDAFGCPEAKIDGDQVRAPLDYQPQIAQRIDGNMFGIGDVALVRPIHPTLRLGPIAAYCAVSYVFSMLARYRPSMWLDIWSARTGDRLMPLVLAFLDDTQARFRERIVDHLQWVADTDDSMLPNTKVV